MKGSVEGSVVVVVVAVVGGGVYVDKVTEPSELEPCSESDGLGERERTTAVAILDDCRRQRPEQIR